MTRYTADPFEHRDWPALAATAAKMLADREAGYPGAVAAGRMTAEQASAGIANMRALAEQWRIITAHEDLPDWADYPEHFGAYPALVFLDIREAAHRAHRLAGATPALASQAERVNALATAQCSRTGTSWGVPQIWTIHQVHQHARRLAAERALVERAKAAPSLPRRAPRPQPAQVGALL